MKQLSFAIVLIFFIMCKSAIKEQNDKVYSRHLQRQVELSILSTPAPDDKNTFNLLILNDGQDLEKMRIKQTVDSLYKKGLLKPLVVVGVHPSERMQEYGVAGSPDYQGNGSSAEKYSKFIDDELYPFIKKRSGVRKFSSVGMGGWSLGGLSAFDIGWDHNDKIDKVGIFSGSFWWRDKDSGDSAYSDDKNRIMLNKITSSHKRLHPQFWFYAGGAEETADRDHDGIIDVQDDTRDLINILKIKKSISDIVYLEIKEGKHDQDSWSRIFPAFLIWAVGK